MRVLPPPHHAIADVVARALAEDLGTAGDITTNAVFGPDDTSTGRIVARGAGVVAGLGAAISVFSALEGDVEVEVAVVDGDLVEAGATLATVSGSTRTLLTGERTFLNLLGHLSGIATTTHSIVQAVDGLDVLVADTRKTTPGLRALEKYAVRCGGGSNHRFGLHDAVMIKDNHVVASGSIAAAVDAVKKATGHTVKIELEIDDIGQVPEALDAGVEIVLLDNMQHDDLRRAVELIDGRAVVEASGGITPATAREIASTGVDVISVGWITHSAPRMDVALDLNG